MVRLVSLSGLFLIIGSTAPEPDLHSRRYFVAAESYESVAVFDVDKNDTLDLVSGDFWYEGPQFRRRHLVGNEPRKDQYYDAGLDGQMQQSLTYFLSFFFTSP